MQVLDKIVSAIAVTPTCPRCKSVIPSEDVNVANDIAFYWATGALSAAAVQLVKKQVTRAIPAEALKP